MNPFGRRGLHRCVGLVWLTGILLFAPVVAFAAPYAAVVMDARSGEILHARNHETRLHPASLTKMMTLYIAFEAVRKGEITLDTPVKISRKAASEVPSKLGLRAGQTIAFRYLIRAAALRSANDAATAIGEAISGSEAAFAQRMTRTARAMGMRNTTFRNAHGLTHPEHLSTALDMTILARQLFFDYPQYYNIFSRRSDDAGIAQVRNTNWRFLDSYRGADGIKTGFTNAAGYNLTGSAERNGKRIIATIFGGTSVPQRTQKMMELLDLGFNQAPTQVAVSPPPPPNYGAVTVADAAANATARTVRINTAVSRSPIPRGRPVVASPPDELLIALQEGIGAALAEAQQDLQTAQAEDPNPELPIAQPEALAVAVTEPEAATQEAVAEVAELATRATSADATVVEVHVTAMSEAVDAPVPEPRPESESEWAAAIDIPEPAAVQAAIADVVAEMSGTPEPILPEEPQIVLTSSTPPSRPAEDLIMAALPEGAGEEAEGMTSEVVTRHLSTSEARMWGINVGRYGSSFDAERALMQTALAEAAVLDGALRKVQRGGGGFDANFVGLTYEQADLACRRLQARDRHCFAVAP